MYRSEIRYRKGIVDKKTDRVPRAMNLDWFNFLNWVSIPLSPEDSLWLGLVPPPMIHRLRFLDRL